MRTTKRDHNFDNHPYIYIHTHTHTPWLITIASTPDDGSRVQFRLKTERKVSSIELERKKYVGHEQ